MSANRIVQRRAYLASTISKRAHVAKERQAARLGLPKIGDRKTFAEWNAERR